MVSYQRSINQLFSDTSRIDLRWVRWLINGYLAIVLLIIAFNLLSFRYPQFFDLWILFIGAVVTIYIYIAAVKGIFQLTVWQIKPTTSRDRIEMEIRNVEKIESAKEVNEILTYRRPGLNDAKIDEIVIKITEAMKVQKLYRERELTLQQLATKFQVPTYLVSLAINEGIKKNFYDLINGYRVEEAKRLLLDPKNSNYTILSVGFEAGFNSKTTFNTVFKKFTGLTPTDFRAKQMITPMPT